MPVPEIPIATLRSLALMLRAAFMSIRARLSRAKPPSGLVVACETGAKYSGVLLVADNRVVGGAMHCSFEAEPLREQHRRFESSSMFDEEDAWR